MDTKIILILNLFLYNCSANIPDTNSSNQLDEYKIRVKQLVAGSYDSNPYFAKKFFENDAFQDEVLLKGIELFQSQAKGELETIVISPGKELEVKSQYRKIIGKLQGKINWFDRFFGKNTLEFLETCTIDDSVKEIKILTSL